MGKTVTILRIERNGLGMYAATKGIGLPFASDASNRHPAPYEDKTFVKNAEKQGWEGGSFGVQHFFGFSSKSQLKRWLHKKAWLLWLCANGFVLCEYTVLRSDAIKGESQAVFVKAQTITRTEHRITEYFSLV